MSGHQPAVSNGVLNYTSVSAIKKYTECKRKWYFRYVLRIPEPMSAGAQFGTEAHDRVETYLKTGTDVLHEVERAGLYMLPKPGPDLLVEETFSPEWPLFAGDVPMSGFIDLLNPRADAAPAPGVLPVTDWKFKKNISQYGASAADLLDPSNEDGIQMVGYGAWVAFNRRRFPEIEGVQVRHGNFQTAKEPRTGRFPTKLVMAEPRPLAFFESAWETVSLKAEAMKQTAKAKDASEVEPNTKACWKYGGCAFRNVCPLSKVDGLMASMADAFRPAPETKGVSEMSLFDEVEKMTPSTPAPNTPAPIKEVLVKVITTNPPKTEALPKRSLILDEDPDAPKAAPSPQEVKVAKAVQESHQRLGLAPHKATEELLARAKANPAPIQPPDAPKSDPALAAKADATTGLIPPLTEAPYKAPAQAAEIEAPKKRGRPKKIEITTGSATETPAIESAPTSTTITTAPASVVFLTAPARTVLWFGVWPQGQMADVLNAYVARIEAEVLAKFAEKGLPKLVDIRTATGEAIGFGKWKGFLAAYVKQNPPPPGHYVVLPGDERVDTVTHAMLDAGAQVGGMR